MSPLHRTKSHLAPPLEGFEHVNRYWDPVHKTNSAKILPGEYYVTNHDEAIATVLGSCVAACVRDKLSGIGGMNHFLLPHCSQRDGMDIEQIATSDANRYGSYAMEHMINDILKHGGQRRNLQVKLFGGGRIINELSKVGARNVQFAKRYLQMERLEILSEDVGDVYPRKVYFFPRTGTALVKKLRSLHNDTIIQRERAYLHEIEEKPVAGEVELF